MNADLWPPTASIDVLKKRAIILSKIRAFFADRGVLEVETPLLARFSVTDPHMDALAVETLGMRGDERYYLQTSPEYAMKRLLVAGSGPIYQLCKAFRKGESGHRHNPEFTMLEWYQPGYNYTQLINEVAELVQSVLGETSFKKMTYRELFLKYTQLDPHNTDCETLQNYAQSHLDIQMTSDSCDDWLNIILTGLIEPQLILQPPTFIYDYPASQSALAKVVKDESGTLIAQRFELYVAGLELANGYFELTDAEEQKQRFHNDQLLRKEYGKPHIESDQYLLAAMEKKGLPLCSGVALGVDRLMMLALNCTSIKDVLTFPTDRA